VWVDQEVQRLQLDFELGIMELDQNGLRIEHNQPLKSFLAELPNSAPYELPSPCEGVVADPCLPAPMETGETIETLPEPAALLIPPAMGTATGEPVTEVRRLPSPEKSASSQSAGSQQDVTQALLDNQG
jgi:hypothetical protein